MFIVLPQLLAFCIVVLVLVIGEWVSKLTKAWIPTMFVAGVLFIAGYWTFFPKDIVASAGVTPAITGVVTGLLITNMGTMLSISDLIKQWRPVLLALSGVVGIVLALFTVGRLFFDTSALIIGTPPLVGGVVSAVLMSEAATKAGLTDYAVLAILIYVMQSFAGYPLTALMLKREGKRLLGAYRQGDATSVTEEDSDAEHGTEDAPPSLFKRLDPGFNTDSFKFLRVGFVAYLAFQTSLWLKPILDVHYLVLCLLFGIIATAIGFLEKRPLQKANGFGFIIMLLLLYILDGLKQATPAMLERLLIEMFGMIIIGVLGMALVSFVASKCLRTSFSLSFSVALTALYGFPGDYIITQEVTQSLTQSEAERKYLLDHMLPPMLTGGFITVTITSVVLAGIFVDLL